MNESLLLTERDGDVALVQLNRASKRNAINDDLMAELEDFFTHGLDGVRAVVLHGAGEHFSAGLDLFELIQKRSPDVMVNMRRSRQWHRVFDMMQFGDVPVISVLKGGVIGGGFEMAAATHVRVCEESTFFQLPEGQRGIFLGGGGSVRIPRLLGSSRVIHMMLTGHSLDAEEALRLGVGHYLVGKGDGLEKAVEVAHGIAKNAPATNYAIINGIARIGEMSMGEGLFAETMVTAMSRSAGTDAARRITEFFDNRREQNNDRREQNNAEG